MITWIRQLLFDETAFLRAARAVLFGLGTAAQSGLIPAGKAGWYLGMAAQASALFIGAGDKNPPNGK